MLDCSTCCSSAKSFERWVVVGVRMECESSVRHPLSREGISMLAGSASVVVLDVADLIFCQ